MPLLLVGAAAGAGAALGLAQTVPLVTASQVVTATATEPGAAFVLTVQVTGPGSTLYQTGTGEIDFSSGNSAITTVSHSVSFGNRYTSISRQRVVGKHMFLESSFTAPATGGWVELPTSLSPDPNAVGGLGSIDAEVLGALGTQPRWIQLVPVGSGELGGVAVNHYLVVYTGPIGQCRSATTSVDLRTEIWVDDQNRLRRSQTTISTTTRGAPLRAGTGYPAPPGSFTTTAVVDFRITSFGNQPKILAPPVTRVGYPATVHSGEVCPRVSSVQVVGGGTGESAGSGH